MTFGSADPNNGNALPAQAWATQRTRFDTCHLRLNWHEC